jgi:[ribosomal protein S5]-alanine N-acetyltransferase
VIALRPMTPEFIEAVLDGRLEDAAAVVGVELPQAFPREGEKRFLALRLRQMRENERFLEWCPYVVVLGRRMIGHAGYHGPPGQNSTKNPDAVEFGYAIEPAFRGRGYATEAAVELMQRAEKRGIKHFVLAISPRNDPSLAIVRKLGFIQTGERMDEEDGLELVFELER